MDVSVVIPAHQDSPGLYFTAVAALSDLEHSGFEYEVIAAVDGEDLVSANVMAQRGAVRKVQGEFGGPQNARHAGAKAATGKYVFFLDSHVIPCRDFFRSMVDAACRTNAAMVFSPHYTWSVSKDSYCGGYGLLWSGNLWSVDHETKPQSKEPYRVCMMGHGGICVDRERYFSSGGYWEYQKGWGGEETHLTLKLWLLGEECYCDPRIYHWHFMGRHRDGNIFQSREHVRNFFLACYAVGGQEYLERAYSYYTLAATVQPIGSTDPPGDPYRDIYEATPIEAAEERQRICAGPYSGELQKLKAFFERENIPH